MKKLMQMLMLNCEDATRLTSIKRYKKLSLTERVRLNVHIFVCKYCSRFAKFNDLLDDSIENTCSSLNNNNEILSEEKKNELKDIIKSKND